MSLVHHKLLFPSFSLHYATLPRFLIVHLRWVSEDVDSDVLLPVEVEDVWLLLLDPGDVDSVGVPDLLHTPLPDHRDLGIRDVVGQVRGSDLLQAVLEVIPRHVHKHEPGLIGAEAAFIRYDADIVYGSPRSLIVNIVEVSAVAVATIVVVILNIYSWYCLTLVELFDNLVNIDRGSVVLVSGDTVPGPSIALCVGVVLAAVGLLLVIFHRNTSPQPPDTRNLHLQLSLEELQIVPGSHTDTYLDIYGGRHDLFNCNSATAGAGTGTLCCNWLVESRVFVACS